MIMNSKIRIRLKAYDHEVLDRSAREIVDTVEFGTHQAGAGLEAVGLQRVGPARAGERLGGDQH